MLYGNVKNVIPFLVVINFDSLPTRKDTIQLARAIDALLRESIDVSNKLLQTPKQTLFSKLFGVKLPNYKLLQDMCCVIINDLDKLYIEISVIDVLGTEKEKAISEIFKNFIEPLRSSVECLLELAHMLENYKKNKKPLEQEAFLYYADLYNKYDVKRSQFGTTMNESFQWLMQQKVKDII